MAISIVDPHGPLTAQEIRLLEIYPSPVTDDLMKCRLFRVDLDKLSSDEAPSYEALSYVWGDITNTAVVTCNGLLVSVTVNLSNALRRLRLTSTPRTIWADAICIDQSQKYEKSCQIPLMGRIYSNAKRVVVWLGEADAAQSAEASSCVKLIADAFRKFKGGELDDARPEEYARANLDEYAKVVVPSNKLGKTAQESLKLLFAEPWFSRVWCIQEITLSKDAIMFWGKDDLSWVDVGVTATWLYQIMPVRILEQKPEAFYYDIDMDNAYHMFRLKRDQHDLLELLSDCRSFKASNLRDKVYGLLALGPTVEVKSLCVDYAKDVGEVFADTVVARIKTHSELTALAYINHGPEYRNEEGFTSWTPQWNTLRGLRQIPAAYSPLSACRGLPVKWLNTTGPNPRHLRLKGLFYSEITQVHLEMEVNNLGLRKSHPFLRVWDAIIEQQDMTEDEQNQKIRTLARTMTAGVDSAWNDIVFASATEQAIYYYSFQMCMYSLRIEMAYGKAMKSMSLEDLFYDQAEIVCMGRRIFETTKGTFGLGPACMREGDIVVVLFGGVSPYILRPNGGTYLFMGQGYVDELMQGELVDEMEAGRIQEQEFCLV